MSASEGISLALYEYAARYSLRENRYLKELGDETLQLPSGRMMAAREQTQFIALLIQLINAKRVIEIGTLTGYTTLAMALALPPEGTVMTCDIQAETPQMGLKYWQKAGVANKIQLFITPGLTLLDELILQHQEKCFDLAFIDADKNNNQQYFEKLLTLIRPGGLIIIDNVLWHGKVIDDSVNDAQTRSIRHFNERLHSDERVGVSIIPLGDGMTLARVR